MSNTDPDRTFHDPNPDKDKPVNASWLTMVNKVIFQVFKGPETAAEARGDLDVYSKSESDADYLSQDGSDAMSGNLDMGTNAVINVGNVDGRDVSADGSKLDGIESGATADQTDAEIQEAVGSVVSATDVGTDAYEFNLGFDLATGDVFTADVGSTNSTASPTGENTGGSPSGAQSIVTTSGAAFIEMLEARPHRFQWDGTNYVVLDPVNRVTTQVFTSSGTWNRPSGVKRVIVEVVGGGGAGGGSASTSASEAAVGQSGGGGGYSRKAVDVTGTSSETVTVGAGGSGGSAGANAGSSGGTSSFGSHLQATGGSGGSGGPAQTGDARPSPSGVSGGSGSDGDVNTGGGGSGYGFVAPGVAAASGTGGDSVLGGGAQGQRTATDAVGVDASGIGGGGSGSANSENAIAHSGGAGEDGIVIVTEFY